MSFLQKIKNFFGIGGVKITLNTPKEINRNDGVVEGSMTLTSKSDKHVKDITVTLEEVWEIGKGDDKEIKEFELGTLEFKDPFDIKAGETKEIDFKLEYELIKSSNDEMQEKGKLGKGLGTLGKLASGEKSTFTVEASASVEGTVFGPVAVESIKLKV